MKKGDLVRYRRFKLGEGRLGMEKYEWDGPGFLLELDVLMKTATVITKEGVTEEFRSSHVQKLGKRGVNPAEQP